MVSPPPRSRHLVRDLLCQADGREEGTGPPQPLVISLLGEKASVPGVAALMGRPVASASWARGKEPGLVPEDPGLSEYAATCWS